MITKYEGKWSHGKLSIGLKNIYSKQIREGENRVNWIDRAK